MKNGSPNLHNQIEPSRIFIFIAFVVVVFLAFILRLFLLQVVQGSVYAAQAYDNRVKEFNIPAMRGIIYDRNGTILARNIASYNVVITANDLPDDEAALQGVFRELSGLIEMPVNLNTLDTPYVPCFSEHGIAQIAEYGLTSRPFEPVQVKCDVDERLAKIVQEKSMDWPGVSIEVQPIRAYPTGSLTASIIGFLGPIPEELEAAYREQGLQANRDKVGYAGLELEYQDLLAGHNGLQTAEVDVAGQIVRSNIEPPIAPQPGLNMRLTIDTRLQQAATEIFKREIDEWNAWFNRTEYSSGVVIAMNPQTGEILAMVSYPSYENNRMTRLIPGYYYNQLVEDPSNPLLNHAVGDVLPAGSVFKLSTAVGALNEGVVDPEQVIDTPPEITLLDRPFANAPATERKYVDWNKAGFGKLDFLGGISNSSNVYFYKLGGGDSQVVGSPNQVREGLGICRLTTYAEALGYGRAPGVGLPDEEDGLIPDPQWKRLTHAESWTLGDTYIASVGQGYVLATPIQVLLSAAIIANNGQYMQPTLIREVLDGEGNVVPVYMDEDGNIVDDPSRADRILSPFTPKMRWDLLTDKIIQEFGETTIRGCEPIEGEYKTVEPWVLETVRQGMRLAVTDGTLSRRNDGSDPIGFTRLNIPAAGKTGTAEYCDKYAAEKNLCEPGNWPSHAWTVAFAPYDNPEIAVVAFVYNGGEGAIVAGPIVRQVIQAYFNLKAIDTVGEMP